MAGTSNISYNIGIYGAQRNAGAMSTGTTTTSVMASADTGILTSMDGSFVPQMVGGVIEFVDRTTAIILQYNSANVVMISKSGVYETQKIIIVYNGTQMCVDGIGTNNLVANSIRANILNLQSVNVTGDVNIGNNLTVGGNTTIAGDLAVDGESAFGDNMTITGNLTAAGHLTIGEGARIAGNLNIIPSSTQPGNINLPGQLEAGAEIISLTNVIAQNQLEGTGLVVGTGGGFVFGPLTVAGVFTTNGAAILNGNITTNTAIVANAGIQSNNTITVTNGNISTVDGNFITSNGTIQAAAANVGNLTATGLVNFPSMLNQVGGLLTFNGISMIQLPPGLDGQVLTCDSTSPLGLRWA